MQLSRKKNKGLIQRLISPNPVTVERIKKKNVQVHVPTSALSPDARNRTNRDNESVEEIPDDFQPPRVHEWLKNIEDDPPLEEEIHEPSRLGHPLHHPPPVRKSIRALRDSERADGVGPKSRRDAKPSKLQGSTHRSRPHHSQHETHVCQANSLRANTSEISLSPSYCSSETIGEEDTDSDSTLTLRSAATARSRTHDQEVSKRRDSVLGDRTIRQHGSVFATVDIQLKKQKPEPRKDKQKVPLHGNSRIPSKKAAALDEGRVPLFGETQLPLRMADTLKERQVDQLGGEFDEVIHIAAPPSYSPEVEYLESRDAGKNGRADQVIENEVEPQGLGLTSFSERPPAVYSLRRLHLDEPGQRLEDHRVLHRQCSPASPDRQPQRHGRPRQQTHYSRRQTTTEIRRGPARSDRSDGVRVDLDYM